MNGNVVSFQRRAGRALSLIVINYGRRKASVQLSGLPPLAPLQAAYPVYARPVRADAKGKLSVSLPGQSLAVFDFRR